MEHLCPGCWGKYWSNVFLLTILLRKIFTFLMILYSLTHLGQQAIWALQKSHKMRLEPGTIEIGFLSRRRRRKREIQWVLIEVPLGWITNVWCNAPWLSPLTWEQLRLPFLPANIQSRHHKCIRELIPRERLWLRSGQWYRLHCSVSLLIRVNQLWRLEQWKSNQAQIITQIRWKTVYFFLTFLSQAILNIN